MEIMLSISAVLILLSYKSEEASGKYLNGFDVLDHWFMDGSDVKVSYWSVSLSQGRCPDSQAVRFKLTENTQASYAEVWPSEDIGKRKSYSIACWINLASYKDSNDSAQVIYSDPMFEKFRLGIEYPGRIFLLTRNASDGTITAKTDYVNMEKNKWKHIAATWDGNNITLYVDGKVRKGNSLHNSQGSNISSGGSSTAFIAGNPFHNYFQFLGSIMDLYVFGTALSPEDVIKVYKGIPVVTDQINQVIGQSVMVTWNPLFEGVCPADKYTVYYREVTSVKWKSQDVSKSVTQYDLELECFKEYELAVTAHAMWRRTEETSLNNSYRWRVKTGQEFPEILNRELETEVKGNTISVIWSPLYNCPLEGYIVRYREVLPGYRRDWRAIFVSSKVTNRHLRLECHKNYEIAVTAKITSGETPLNQSRLLKVRTGQDIPEIESAVAEKSNVTVTWKEPFDGECPVTNYTVLYKEDEAVTWKEVIVSENETRTTLPLKCSEWYKIQIKAWGLHGVTPRSKSITVKTSGDAPFPITHGTIRNLSDCKVNLTWSPPRDNGCSLKKYTVYYREIGQREEDSPQRNIISILDVSRTFSVLPLKCSREYELRMTASNRAGESHILRPWRITTADCLEIINAYNGTGVKLKGKTITVKWTLMKCHFEMYLLRYREVPRSFLGIECWRVIEVSPRETHRTLVLECHKEYEISVTGKTSSGKTPPHYAKFLRVWTGQDVPQIESAVADKNKVTVTWKEPFDGECPVTKYTAYYKEVGRPDWKKVIVSKNETRTTLQLKCSEQYEIQINAGLELTWSLHGQTPHSESHFVTTFADAPSPITNGSIRNLGDCKVNLTWSPPRDNGCPPTKFTVFYREIGQTEGDSPQWNLINILEVSKTFIVLPLNCSREYELRMTASNRAGKSNKTRPWHIITAGSKTNSQSSSNSNSNSNNNNNNNNKNSNSSDVIVVGVVTSGIIFVLLMALLIVLVQKWRKKRIRLKSRRSKYRIDVLMHREVPPHRVTFMEELGRGAYGKVYKGVLTDLPGFEVFFKPKEERVEITGGRIVAVKALLDKNCVEGKNQFLQEIEFMKQIGSHKNVLSMLGYWVKSEPIMLILEYVPHGDLLQWLRSKRQKIKLKNRIDWNVLGELAACKKSSENGETSSASQEKENKGKKEQDEESEEELKLSTLVETDPLMVKESDDLENKKQLTGSKENANKIDGSEKRSNSKPAKEPLPQKSTLEDEQEALISTGEKPCVPLNKLETSMDTGNIAGPSGLAATRTESDTISESEEDGDEDLSAKDFLSFAWQVAQGMNYLARRGFVHRDLAARNVLIGEDRTLKIADFGMLRHTYHEIYEVQKTKKLPIKWTAPEALQNSIYTTKSDVWSFGVFLWELATVGGTPYPGIENKDLFNLLKRGYRLQKPDTCSEELYSLMSGCWMEDPDDRPTFEQLVSTLENMMTKNCPYFDFEKYGEITT